MTALYVAVGGAAGAVSRYLVASWLQRSSTGGFPRGTFAVNVLGSFALGVIMAAFAARGRLDTELRVAISVGFLGGFTTYSSFALETVDLLEQRDYATAATYVCATLVCAGVACAVGMLAVRALAQRYY